jgi:hypothetical protein
MQRRKLIKGGKRLPSAYHVDNSPGVRMLEDVYRQLQRVRIFRRISECESRPAYPPFRR